MGLHPYCITPADHVPAGTGIDGAPLRTVVHGTIAAWVSEHPEPPHASLDAARLHDQVIRRAMSATVTPVPLRFGQWAADETVLRQRLEDHAERWSELLAGFAGAVEMGLRFIPERAPAPPEPRPDSGRAYMQQLAARVHERDAAGHEHARLLEAVAGLLGQATQRTVSGTAPDDVHGLWVAHLVRLDQLEEYRLLAARLAAQTARYRTLVSGPWPPYSFVT